MLTKQWYWTWKWLVLTIMQPVLPWLTSTCKELVIEASEGRPKITVIIIKQTKHCQLRMGLRPEDPPSPSPSSNGKRFPIRNQTQGQLNKETRQVYFFYKWRLHMWSLTSKRFNSIKYHCKYKLEVCIIWELVNTLTEFQFSWTCKNKGVTCKVHL